MKCNNCGDKATHRCNRQLHPHDVAEGVWMYHCPKHAHACCEALNASSH